jgi:PBSX family phage portal protein
MIIDKRKNSSLEKLDSPRAVSRVTMVNKADGGTAGMVTNGTDSNPEDVFAGSYTTQGGNGTVSIIEPTFVPLSMKRLVTQNNILAQCIEAMEVNVDGTGHSIELIPDQKEAEKEKQILTDFFNEPYPGKSMVSMRRDLRHDLEATGNGYLEAIRSVGGDLIMLNVLEAVDIRMIRYDDPVFVTKTVTRAGAELTVKIRARERRFVQTVNGKKIYFKEFGASRELDRDTGLWAAPGVQLSVAKRASEILHFTVTKEAKTPYGTPRWINQMPSVLGSRKAEEFNLDFFDSGGLPPVLVLVQGGYLGEQVRADLAAHLGGKGTKHRAAIVEAISSSGSLDSSGSVKVTVERFGTERQQDSMFQQYDKNCEEHVRVAFRLPPLFVGRAQDYNFATAQTGYMVAEAQVFGPERLEFDEKMKPVVKALGVKSYEFKSKPLTITSIEDNLKALELAVGKVASGETVLDEINKLTGMHLEYEKPAPLPLAVGQVDPATGEVIAAPPPPEPGAPTKKKLPASADASGGKGGRNGDQSADPSKTNNQTSEKQPEKKPTARDVKKTETLVAMIGLVEDWGNVIGLRGPCTKSDEEVTIIKHEVSSLEGEELKQFNELMAARSLTHVEGTIEGLAALCGAVTALETS